MPGILTQFLGKQVFLAFLPRHWTELIRHQVKLGAQNQKKAISRKNRSQGKYCNCKVQIFDFYVVLAGS